MKWSSALFRIVVIFAFAAAAGVICFLIYALTLRTDYRETVLEINDTVLENMGSAAILQDGETVRVPDSIIDYYNRFLLGPDTLVYSRKSAEQTDQTITLVFQDKTLSFTGLEDGTAIHLLWQTPEKEKSFRVRSTTTFMQLKAYWENYKKREKMQS